MSEEEKLNFYIEKIQALAQQHLKEKSCAMQALKKAVNYIEGEYTGY